MQEPNQAKAVSDWSEYRYWVVQTLEDIKRELQRVNDRLAELSSAVIAVNKDELVRDFRQLAQEVKVVEKKVHHLSDWASYTKGKTAIIAVIGGAGASGLIELVIRLLFRK